MLALLLVLVTSSAGAHDVSPAALRRLNAMMMDNLDFGWLGIPLLVLGGVGLGALHGLEPGHSKTMMSAFIIAIGGTVAQAAVLGAAATVSHTAVVWLLVVPVMIWGGAIDLAGNEPYFEIASALAVLTIGAWQILRLWRQRSHRHRPRRGVVEQPPTGGPDAAPLEPIETGHGLVRLEIVESDGAPRFRVQGIGRSGRLIPFTEPVEVRTRHADGTGRTYAFADQGQYLQSLEPVPSRNGFVATLRVLHDDHAHEFPVSFGLPIDVQPDATYVDAHERAHAEELQRRLRGGKMTTWQIVLFGLSGGLLPCPAAVTVLLLCLQLKRIGLGIVLVTSFSLGLAVTMITVGAIAAFSVRHLARRWSGVSAYLPLAASLSCMLILGIGLYMLIDGLTALA